MKGPNVGFVRRLRCLLMPLFAPDFWRDFPEKDEAGPWAVDAIVTGLAFSHVRHTELVKGGMWDAYIRSRKIAVAVDWTIPRHPDNEVGVDWGIRKPTESELGYDIPERKKAA